MNYCYKLKKHDIVDFEFIEDSLVKLLLKEKLSSKMIQEISDLN